MADRPDTETALGAEGLPTGELYEPTPEERRARKVRNLAIAGAVVGFVVLVYITTFFRLAASIEAGRAAAGA
jgi:hypothetical protein